jgi:hypothetical protein
MKSVLQSQQAGLEFAVSGAPNAEFLVMLLTVKFRRISSSLILMSRLSTLLSSDARSSSTSLSYFAERISCSLASWRSNSSRSDDSASRAFASSVSNS